MSNKEPKNCWEFWECPEETKKECLAYRTNSGDKCWTVVTTFEDKKCPAITRIVKGKFKGCSECVWFKKLNPKIYKQQKKA